MPINELWRREVTVRTAYGAAPGDLPMALDLIATGACASTTSSRTGCRSSGPPRGSGSSRRAAESVKVVIEP